MQKSIRISFVKRPDFERVGYQQIHSPFVQCKEWADSIHKFAENIRQLDQQCQYNEPNSINRDYKKEEPI